MESQVEMMQCGIYYLRTCYCQKRGHIVLSGPCKAHGKLMYPFHPTYSRLNDVPSLPFRHSINLLELGMSAKVWGKIALVPSNFHFVASYPEDPLLFFRKV
jgi:hypothetical protein